MTGQEIVQVQKKSCRGIEQVREAKKRKINPFVLENDTEIIQREAALESGLTVA